MRGTGVPSRLLARNAEASDRLDSIALKPWAGEVLPRLRTLLNRVGAIPGSPRQSPPMRPRVRVQLTCDHFLLCLAEGRPGAAKSRSRTGVVPNGAGRPQILNRAYGADLRQSSRE